MDSMDKVWNRISKVEEVCIRHDERLKANESQNQKAMESIAKLEGELSEKFDSLGHEIREGFRVVGERIDNIETQKAEAEGYKKGRKEERLSVYKQVGLWVAIATFAFGVIAWRVTQ